MSNRCPDCSKFVSLEMNDSPDIDYELKGANVTGSVRLVLECSDCGNEMSETNQDFDFEVDALAEHLEETEGQEGEHETSIDMDSAEVGDYMQSKDRNGKTIKNFRYMRHIYTCTIDFTVTCSCGATFEASTTIEEQASAFDSLV